MLSKSTPNLMVDILNTGYQTIGADFFAMICSSISIRSSTVHYVRLNGVPDTVTFRRYKARDSTYTASLILAFGHSLFE
jgi:hypothetical protein